MTGGAALTNQPNPDAMVEGTTLTVEQMGIAVASAGMGMILLSLLMVPLFLVVPRGAELTLPRIRLEW